jgi:hypothetical protein
LPIVVSAIRVQPVGSLVLASWARTIVTAVITQVVADLDQLGVTGIEVQAAADVEALARPEAFGNQAVDVHLAAQSLSYAFPARRQRRPRRRIRRQRSRCGSLPFVARARNSTRRESRLAR